MIIWRETVKLLRPPLELPDAETQAAMDTLESYGLVFCVHFGFKNATMRLRALNSAMERGCLYEHLRDAMGICTTAEVGE